MHGRFRPPTAGMHCDPSRVARQVDPRTTTIYDRRRGNFDRHAGYVGVAFVAGA
jgi:hypothetical protein